jgi:hypothetical protein
VFGKLSTKEFKHLVESNKQHRGESIKRNSCFGILSHRSGYVGGFQPRMIRNSRADALPSSKAAVQTGNLYFSKE